MSEECPWAAVVNRPSTVSAPHPAVARWVLTNVTTWVTGAPVTAVALLGWFVVPVGAACWLDGTPGDVGTAGWPACGEMDIMEFRGQEPLIVHGSLHGPGYSGGAAITRAYSASAPLDSAFHVYAVEWTPEKMDFYYDDTKYHTLDLSAADDQGKQDG